MRGEADSSAIAVVGMACRYPGANDLRTFWENILSRRRQFRTFPDQRLPLSDYYDPDPSAPDKTYCNKAALIDGFDFDWISHRIPKTSFLSSDIAHWLALDVALQALADTGLHTQNVPRERSGVILGNTLTGEQSRAEGLRLRWPFISRTLNAAARARGLSAQKVSELDQTMESYYKSVFAPVTEDTLAGSLSNTIAGRICNYLDFHGGGYTVDGACSSGLVAVATAVSSLADRDLDLALAGGVDISLDTFELIGFAKVGALSKTDMRVYDRRGNGFLPGEGCGFVALKRLEDAISDGNYVYAVIRGWGISSDGKGGLTAPSVGGQAIALKRAYDRAGFNPQELDFIEGHGTGTVVGDRVELEAISRVLGEEELTKDRSCGVTSLKSIIGHTKAASGIGGLIKAVIAANRRVLPPTANCTYPNEVFESSARMLYPILAGEVRIPTEKLKAGVSAMGFGGINCHVTLESGDIPSAKLAPSVEERKLMVAHQETELFILSSGSPAGLIGRARAVSKRAQGISEGELVDLAAQLTQEHDPNAPIRAAFIAGSPERVLECLEEIEKTINNSPLHTGEKIISPQKDIVIGNTVNECRVGFLFPGQGSQQLNMAGTLVERHEWARELAERADGFFRQKAGRTLTEYIFKPLDKAVDGSHIDEWSAMLRDTAIAQPALCLCSLLWVERLNRLGIKPVAVGGHSLGELTAFHVAGAFDEEALLKLSMLRGEAMGAPANESGIMASLACRYDTAMDMLSRVEGYAVVANINSPKQVVISGERSSVEKVVSIAAGCGIVTHILPVSNAFHSKFVSTAAERLRSATVIPEILGRTQLKLFSCSDGKLVEPGLKLRDHFASQATSRVDFVSLVQALAQECDVIIEPGPGKVLSNLSNAITGGSGPLFLPIESKTGVDRDFNRLLGEYFVRGGNVIWEELYEGRLVRPFVPASDRRFIENPCERPFNVSTSEMPRIVPQISKDEGLLQRIFADSAQVSPEVIEEYIARRGHFLGAVIKADLEHFAPQAQHTARVLPDSHDFSEPAQAVPEKKETLPPNDNVDDRASTSGLLFELIEKRTGFPRESLSMELRLLDDLNLDSIKAAELIAAAAMRLGLAGNLNASQFTNARLSEISAALARLVKEGAGAEQKADAKQESSAPDHNRKTWVRNFAVHYVPETLPLSGLRGPQKEEWVSSRVLILCEESELNFATTLESELVEKGAHVKALLFSGSHLSMTDGDVEFTHYITILPSMPNNGLSPDARLRAMIERLRTAAVLQSSTTPPGMSAAVTYIQFGGGYFGAEMEDGNIEQCCAASFAASLHHERPELKVRVLDFSPHSSPAAVANSVINELSTPGHYSAAGYDREMTRRVPRPRIQEPAESGKRSITWSSDDVVVVTGGAKGITAECSLAFARATGARMVLVGSSPHPDSHPETGRKSEIARILGRFSSEGLSCRYYSCDVTDTDSLDLLIQRVRREFGRITGVIHGAGLNRPNRIENVSSEEALKEIGPKLFGAMNLCLALRDVPPKMFVGFTSIIGITGMPGNGWYAFSNEALDILLRKFNKDNPGTSVLSIAFSIWEEVGMGARMGSVRSLAKMGIGSIPTEEGVHRFLDLLLNDPGASQIIVTARLSGLDTWTPELYSIPAASRFLENIVTLEPNVEVISRVHLNFDNDAYIKDHLYKGFYLFPAVFGFEAMAQAVACVTGRADFKTFLIEDVRFDRPILVFPDAGCTIEIRAEVIEREPDESRQRVHVVIATEQTDFSADHFSATFILGDETKPPVEHVDLPKVPLDIEPKRDLYGGLLFQGPLFQRIEKIYLLNSKKCVFLCRLLTPPAESGGREGNTWLSGDPFFRDSLLHAPQIPLSRDICLPLRIGRFERYGINSPAPEFLAGVAVIEDHVDREVTATVYVMNERGQVMERITGYVLKVLEHNEEYPTAEEIADPGQRDENIIRSEIERRARQLELKVPEISVSYFPGVHELPKRERHREELPLLKETVQRALKSNGFSTDEFRIRWLKSGKPRLEGMADSKLDISLSHDEGTVLCVAGQGPQGCDIASVTNRTWEEWIALFGKAREPLFKQLLDGIDSQDRAGTRIWAAIEAVHKTTASLVTDLSIEKQQGDGVLFRSDFSNKGLYVFTFPVMLTRSPERIIAFVVQTSHDRVVTDVTVGTSQNIPAGRLNFDSESYKFNVASGPQGRPLFIFQFPVTFKEAANPSRTLYFSHYFAWIGKLREFAIQPIFERLIEYFATGKWGMVTNHAETSIVGDAQSGDIIEGRVWVDRISGKALSTIDVCFEWWKKTHDGIRKQLAFSTMSTTWVAIRGHGVVEVQPLPEFIKEFLVKVLPPSYAEEGHFESFAPASSFDCGKEIYRVPVGPIQPAALLKERIFETTLEDANLVGNIYFSNYYLWQGRVRDHYMNEIAPEYFSGSGKQGELRCMQCKVNHINEAMPFDGIAVRMYRTAVYERGITFYFDYYRVGSDGDRKKLGHGEHSAVWFAPTKENKWVPSALPQNILDALLPEKSPANPVSTPAPQSGSNGKYDVIIVSSRT